MEQEAQKILRGNSFKVNVKIFTRLEQFLERLDSMNEHKESLEEGIKFRPDEKYPGSVKRRADQTHHPCDLPVKEPYERISDYR